MSQNIDFSIVLPFYNEEKVVQDVLIELDSALSKQPFTYEIIAVVNGSKDATPFIVDKVIKTHPKIKKVSIPVNLGYSHGVITGLAAAQGNVLGFMDGDAQVSTLNLLRCYEKLREEMADFSIFQRESRGDGLTRKFCSAGYNSLMRVMFKTPVRDSNAKPKLFSRRLYAKMLPLAATGWFIDAELLIKAKEHNAKIVQVPGAFRKREEGRSNVRASTLLEFAKNMVKVKLRGFK